MRIVCLFFYTFVFIFDLQAQTDIVAEAEQFAKESQFLRKHGRYAIALEKAEAAAAMNPLCFEYREHLIYSLSERGREMLGTISAHPNPTDAEGKVVLPVLQYLEQCVELYESLPVDYRIQGCPGYIHNSPLTRLRNELSQTMENKFPEHKATMDRCNVRLVEYWMKTRYQLAMETSMKEKKHYPFIPEIRKACEDYLTVLPEYETALCLETMVSDYLDMTKAFGVEKIETFEQTEIYRVFGVFSQRLLLKVIRLSLALKNRKPSERDERIELILDRILAMLESDSRSVFRHYGWILRNTPFSGKTEKTGTEALAYFEKLESYVRSLPEEDSSLNCHLFYREFRNAAWGISFRKEYAPYLDRVLRLANSRREIAYDVLMEYIYTFRISRQNNEGDSLPDSVIFLETTSTQIGLLEKFAPEKAIVARDRIRDTRIGVDNPAGIKPWKKEIVLYSEKNKDPAIYPPLIRANTMYVICRLKDSLRCDAIDLKTFEVRRGNEWAIERGTDNWVDFFYWNNPRPLYLDETNVYLGMPSRGVIVFPQNGSTPWTLTSEDGLPSNNVQAIGTFQGKLFLGLGDRERTSWFVCVDLEKKAVEILASSLGKEGKSPFSNISPAPRYNFFCEDTWRNRLLIHISGTSDVEGLGLWALDGKTGDYFRLHYVHGGPVTGHFLRDGRLFFTDGTRSFLFDFDRDEDDPERCVLLTGEYNGRGMPSPKIADCPFDVGTIYDGFIYGRFTTIENSTRIRFCSTWGRVALDGRSAMEYLRVPEVIAQPHWAPFYCLVTPDNRGLLVCDGRNLIFLRFE